MATRKLLLALSFLLAGAGPLCAQPWRSDETQTVEAATAVLGEIARDPLRGIPQTLLADAQAIAIIPDVIKGGFVVGLRHGRGVVLVRDEKGQWRAPVFMSLTGGSVGWQIGLQGSDVVLVFRSRRGVDSLLRGKLTVGADVAVAAGPVGRAAAAGTDGKLSAEVYSYARTRGLFAGLALDGSVLSPDERATAAFYGPAMPGQPASVPASAVRLLEALARYTAPPREPEVHELPKITTAPVPELERARRQLVDAAVRLQPALPDAWKSYLALPPEVYSDKGTPSVEAMAEVASRFATVSKDPRYQTLAARVEFRAAQDALTAYVGELRARAGTLGLPPPPK